MITKAIHYLYASRAIGTVIVPFWLSFGQLSQESFGIMLVVFKRLKEGGDYGMEGTNIHC